MGVDKTKDKMILPFCNNCCSKAV